MCPCLYVYGDSHYKDKIMAYRYNGHSYGIMSYLYNGIYHTGKISSLHWDTLLEVHFNGRLSSHTLLIIIHIFKTFRPKQNGYHFQTTFSNVFYWLKMYKFILWFHRSLFPNCQIDNIPALVRIMAWCRAGDKQLSEAMMASLLTHICVTWSQWVNLKP